MQTRRILGSLFAVCAVLAISVAASRGDDAAALTKDNRFVGRWDLRKPDRAVTVNSGSSVRAQFEGTALRAKFDLAANKPPLPTIAWRVDEGDWQEAEIAAEVELAKDLKEGQHTVTLVARGLDEHQSRWSPPLVASITFTGFGFSSDGKLLQPPPAWAKPVLKLEIIGDSITEGVLVHSAREGKKTWPWQTDGRMAYPFQTAERLGAEIRQVGFGAQGVTHGGSGGTPSAVESFNFFYKGCPRDDWQPDVVVINQGTNDGGAKPENFRPIYAKYLAEIRAAYPKALIVALQPFNGAHAADIAAEVRARNDAKDADFVTIKTAGWLGQGDFTDGLHPNERGSTKAADKLAPALKEILETRK